VNAEAMWRALAYLAVLRLLDAERAWAIGEGGERQLAIPETVRSVDPTSCSPRSAESGPTTLITRPPGSSTSPAWSCRTATNGDDECVRQQRT
jgi:hypothetical protein